MLFKMHFLLVIGCLLVHQARSQDNSTDAPDDYPFDAPAGNETTTISDQPDGETTNETSSTPLPSDNAGASCISLDDNDVHPHGAEYRSVNGRFRYRCENGKEMIIGCYYMAESNVPQLMPVGEGDKVVGKRRYKCVRDGENNVRYSSEGRKL